MSANKWVGGTLIVLGGLTDAGALTQGNGHHGAAPSQAASLVVGTASLAGGLWLWNEDGKHRSGGQHRSRSTARRGPRYTGRPR